MAKLNAKEWQAMREDYEVQCISAYTLSKKYNVAESTISRRLKKHGWDRKKTQVVIDKKVSATRAFAELEEKNASITQAVNREVDKRLRMEGVFLDSIELNQKIADHLIKKGVKDKTVDLAQVDTHSKIANRNKDGVLGKTPQTQVNIQNNNSLKNYELSGKELANALSERGLPYDVLDE